MAGAVLFGTDHLIQKIRGHGVIRVPQEIIELTQSQLAANWGRRPTDAELRAHLQRWINEEALFREGLRLGLEQGDALVRERITLRTLQVIQLGTPIPEPSEEQLAAWYGLRKTHYETPARLHLQVLQMASQSHSTADEQSRILKQLGSANVEPQALGKLAIFQGIPAGELALRYDENFAQHALKAQPHRWTPYKVGDVLFFFNVEKIQPGFKPIFAEIRLRIIEDWKQDYLQTKLDHRISELVRPYRIEWIESSAK